MQTPNPPSAERYSAKARAALFQGHGGRPTDLSEADWDDHTFAAQPDLTDEQKECVLADRRTGLINPYHAQVVCAIMEADVDHYNAWRRQYGWQATPEYAARHRFLLDHPRYRLSPLECYNMINILKRHDV